jgi:hypothetical protein
VQRTHPPPRRRVCLVPATATSPDDLDGIIICWTPSDTLTHDTTRPGLAGQIRHELNHTLARVLDHLGFTVEPFGPGASLVTGHHPSTTNATAAGVR